MKKLILRTSRFILILSLIGFVSFLTIKDEKKWNKEFWETSILFSKKKQNYEDFIKDKESINLLMGSSIMVSDVIPDSLGKKWYSFSNTGQSLYNGYKFLEYYKDSVRIDTILQFITPFNFPFSYLTDNARIGGGFNIDFIAFGKDSITTYISNNLPLLPLQRVKSRLFPTFEDVKPRIFTPEKRRYSKQGFDLSILISPSINEDFEYHSNPKGFTNDAIRYFTNVKKTPNFKYFHLFNSFCEQEGIDVIYLLPPMSKYYTMRIENERKEEWNAILDSLNAHGVELWDYERVNDSLSSTSFYRDVTHLSYNGAKIFTRILKERISNNGAKN